MFSDEYATPEDYILGITERIWEGRGVGLIRRYYAPGVAVHTGSGEAEGVEAVVSGTLETLHAFPERRLLGEDVIWSDDPDGRGYSSHRVLSTMRHEGEGAFGPPTGRTVKVRTIADCAVRGDLIVEEWLVRDQAGIAVQLGLEPRELGRVLGAGSPAGKPLPKGDPAAALDAAGCAEAMLRVWNGAELQLIRGRFDPAVALELPGARSAAGTAAAERFVVGYLAAFPGCRVTVEHAITRGEPGRALRVALRWRLDGVHAGRGAFGAPSGVAVSFPGITHLELVDGRVVRAWVLVDELGIWTAIGRAVG